MVSNRQIYRSPLRYPGGKGCIFKFMTQFLEENDLIGTDYAEPYAGGAGLALRLMMDEYVGDVFINDLDPSIYAFWYVVLNRADALCEWIEQVPITVEQWNVYRKIQANYKTADILELAKSTFFLSALTNLSATVYWEAVALAPPEIISGVRDSSIKMESASSTIQKFNPRRTLLFIVVAILSLR